MPPYHGIDSPSLDPSGDSDDSQRSSSAFSRNASIASSQASTSPPSIRCVLVGDSAVGKTSLIVSYTKPEENEPLRPYVPTTFDNYAVSVTVENRPIKLQLCDTSGQDEFSTLRSVWYSEADVFILCFNVVHENSIENVTSKWLPEIKKCCPNTPIVLAGLQSDKRDRESQGFPVQCLNDLADKIPCCVGYLECSSVESKGEVKEVFDLAIFAALNHHGFVKKRRGLTSFRCKKYKCKSEMWSVDRPSSKINMQVPITKDRSQVFHKQRKSYSLKSIFSCFCGHN